jgi:endoglucanase
MDTTTRRSAIMGLAVAPFLVGPRSSATGAARCGTQPFRLGVSLAGAEFGMIGGRWKWPHIENLRYYLGKGFNVFRVPMKWNRLQPVINEPIREDLLGPLDALIQAATGVGAVIILDVHDYGRRGTEIIGSPGSDATIVAFATFWQTLAQRYRSNPLVWYSLINEPHDQDAELSLAAQNAACAAIRAGGGRGKVLFSGTAWTGAHSWTTTKNSTVMLRAQDPQNNYAFEMHQYLDKRFGGSSPVAVPGSGSIVLTKATEWARANGKKIFLGEFAAGSNPASMLELTALLDTVMSNRDVFIGATYWAGGGVWGVNNQNTTDPVDRLHPVDRAQTTLLMRYLRDRSC